MRPGELFDPADCRGIAVIESGALLVEFVSLSGTELLLHRLEAGEQVVDLRTVSNPAYAVCYRAETTTRIAEQADSAADHGLVMRLVYKALNSCFRMIHELSSLQASHRLYCELLRMDAAATRRGDGTCTLPTQSILATRLGTARETISRELSFLRRRNVISAGSTLEITNRAFLLQKIGYALQLSGEEDIRAAVGI